MYYSWLLVFMMAPVGYCPLKVLDLDRQYCPNPAVVSMRLENKSASRIAMWLSVQKKNGAGKWEPFVSDVFADSAYPMQSTVVMLDGHGERQVQWHPPRWMTREPLGEGEYRIVALLSPGIGQRARTCPLREFLVTRAACR